MVEYIVAIDVTRVRFPADALLRLAALGCGIFVELLWNCCGMGPANDCGMIVEWAQPMVPANDCGMVVE